MKDIIGFISLFLSVFVGTAIAQRLLSTFDGGIGTQAAALAIFSLLYGGILLGLRRILKPWFERLQ